MKTTQAKILLPLTWCALAAGLAAADFLTGAFYPFSYAFIIPVGLASWYSGRRMGHGLAAAMPALQTAYFHDRWMEAFGALAIAANLAMQVAAFLAFSELTHRVASGRRLRRRILDSIPIGMWVLNRDGGLEHANAEGLDIWGGLPVGDASAGKEPRIWTLDSPTPLDRESRPVFQVLRRGITLKNEILEIERPDGSHRIILGSAMPVFSENGEVEGAVVVNQDITEAKRLEKEREDLIRSLDEAMRSIKILRGLLPICASCKKIRDDKGSWEEIERYIRSHSEAEFSHGICPDCIRRDYPKYAERLLSR